eukprot:scaffold95719_cov46-Phaeocystis_antarctica.AAC.1
MVYRVLGLRVGARVINGDDERRWLARLGCRLDGCFVVVEQGRPRDLGRVGVLDIELLEDLPTKVEDCVDGCCEGCRRVHVGARCGRSHGSTGPKG